MFLLMSPTSRAVFYEPTFLAIVTSVGFLPCILFSCLLHLMFLLMTLTSRAVFRELFYFFRGWRVFNAGSLQINSYIFLSGCIIGPHPYGGAESAWRVGSSGRGNGGG